ncbi:hypothetical protein FIV00_10915 [Labrenzia sp. THAF82]|uniref:hypothetical protein n=1 Tax=Labrenzia sp. THAF82 TaxID=2587861 RepID=UPI00126897EC|nr:hypothetical protein [Labrenzia sp. THAF82]QFT30989.1 hypothetical protein FIV00_10915 [Labrenzia sp. THAF82]
MNADIIEFIGFEPHWETDHTETAMAKVVGTANYRVRYPDGLEEELLTGIRPGENNAWNIKVIAAAQAWLDAGGVIPEWVPPSADEIRTAMPPLTSRQIRLGLFHSGTTEDDVASIIAKISNPAERAVADIEWRTADTFERTHPLVTQLGPALGYTPEVIDDLWAYYLTI